MHIWFAAELNCSLKTLLKIKFIIFHFAIDLKSQVKVHDFNAVLVQEKFSHSIFCNGVTRTSVGGVSSSRINRCPSSLRHELDQVVSHLCLDGHPLQPECL